MAADSSLEKLLAIWVSQGGDLRYILKPLRNRSLKSTRESQAVCAALDKLYVIPDKLGERTFGSSLFTLATFFQEIESKRAFAFLQKNGLPRLRLWVHDFLHGKEVDEDDVLFILKILAIYQQLEDITLIVECARKPIDAANFMWSIIFHQFSDKHPYAVKLVDALSNPLPTGFISVAFLDLSNALAIKGQLDRHPFDTEAGKKQLELWLRDASERNFSYARSATTALPFIDQSSRKGLLEIALAHPDASIRMEAAWSQGKLHEEPGLERLSHLCLDPCQSYRAQEYLKELGYPDRIPEQARQPEFQAIAKMAEWLAHPNEFGRPPDNIELYDTRELFWPPTNDKRRLWLVKYTYHATKHSKLDSGIGMVGSVTFALFGEATSDLPPEEIYGIHCCWELEKDADVQTSKQRSALGLEILRRHNPDL